ncbi:MAG: hypothetical protein E7620_01865 [Ruminococcaceae bacterium]|nr:hypothetical protein [Oscillospiraceae bacterium]
MKRNVRLFSVILALICAISMFPAMRATAAPAPHEQIDLPDNMETIMIEGEEYRIIRTAEEMNNYAEARVNVILAADLDYTGLDFKKIKTAGTTFNGNGYAIYGFEVGGDGNPSVFGCDNMSGTDDFNVIQNITVGLPDRKVKISSELSGKSVGAILGYSNAEHTLENITVYANVSSKGGTTGGICGNVKGILNMKNCVFYGTVTETDGGTVGGLFGKVNSLSLTMEDCVNYGAVSGTNDAGGIIASVTGNASAPSTVVIRGCANFGMAAGSSVAGMIGSAGTNGTIAMENCLNVGLVDAKSNGGGLFGYLKNCASVEVSNCANVGAVNSKGKAGGLFAMTVPTLKIDNCGTFSLVSSTGTECGSLVGQNDATVASATNLFYTAAKTTTNTLLTEGATQKTLEEGIVWTNALFGKTFGNLILNSDGNCAVPADPQLVGVQESAVAEGKFKVRLVATLNDSLRYSAVGFTVALEGGNTVTKECQSVYRKLIYTKADNTTGEITAAQLDGTYVFALAIDNVPATGTVTFKVTPYAKALDGTTVYSGTSYNVTYTNGAYVGTLACD